MNRRPVRAAARDDRGQALVEFALVAPVLLLLVIGIVEFGRAWNTSQVLTQAAREGARIAAVYNPSMTEDSVRAVIGNTLAAAGIEAEDVEVTLDNWDGDTDTPVVVTLACEYRFVFFGALIGWATDKSTVTIRSSFAMRNE